MSRYGGRAVFVGNLPEYVKSRDLEDVFYKYGRIRTIDVKRPQKPPFYAFVEYEDTRSARDAAHGRNNYDFDGHRLRVEIANGGSSPSSSIKDFYRPPRESRDYRLYVIGLPKGASWQDLKDFARKVCTPIYTEIFRDYREGVVGVIEFDNKDDMRDTQDRLDRSEFTNPMHRSSTVRLYRTLEEIGRSSRRHSRSRSRSRSRDSRRRNDSRDRRSSRRSISRSPVSEREDRQAGRRDDRDRSRSKSPRPAGDRSRSRNRSRSASRGRSLSHSPVRGEDETRREAEKQKDEEVDHVTADVEGEAVKADEDGQRGRPRSRSGSRTRVPSRSASPSQ